MNPTIVVCGNGPMTQAMLDLCTRNQILCGRYEEHSVNLPAHEEFTHAVGVHFGSGRQFAHFMAFCERNKMPVIDGSTKHPAATESKVVYIRAANLSLPIVRFMGAFPAFAQAIMPGMNVRLIESHQAKKADKSGTARTLAPVLGLNEEQIKSIRDPDEQLAFGIPAEFIDGHAYHTFVFDGQGVTLEVRIKIHGRVTYAEGAIMLARALLLNKITEFDPGVHGIPLEPGVYNLKDQNAQRVLSLLERQE